MSAPCAVERDLRSGTLETCHVAGSVLESFFYCAGSLGFFYCAVVSLNIFCASPATTSSSPFLVYETRLFFFYFFHDVSNIIIDYESRD